MEEEVEGKVEEKEEEVEEEVEGGRWRRRRRGKGEGGGGGVGEVYDQDLLACLLTSGSPVVSLVWMRILPTVGSLQTDASAGSRTSPARRMETPHNWMGERDDDTNHIVRQ